MIRHTRRDGNRIHGKKGDLPAPETTEGCLGQLIAFASEFLERECAEGSDPGLCVAVPEQGSVAAELVAFGRRAKEEVITREPTWSSCLAGRSTQVRKKTEKFQAG